MKNIINLTKLINIRLLRTAGLFFLDFLFFTNTNVNGVASYVLAVGFILVVLTLYELTDVVLGFLKLYGLPVKRKTLLTRYITLTAGILIAFKSIGQLSGRDILVIIPLAILSYIYMSYPKSDKRQIT
jgi:hypothetical protein